MKKLSFILFLFIVFSCTKKENKIEINTTDYIANIPTDKSFKNKFIVLEFWATWCAPCIDAVPHINDLQEKFKSNNDLIFISITDEKPEKVMATLKHIDFKTIVISDQSKKTHKSLNIDGIPETVLIDNEGIVRWKGSPNALNEELIKNFINGKLKLNINEKKDKITNNKCIEDNKNRNLEDTAFEIIKNKKTKYSFTLLESQGSSSMIVNALAIGKYININNKLSKIIADLEDVSEFQIQIPENIKKNNYSLIYKNLNFKDANNTKEDVKFNLLKALNLTQNIKIVKTEVYKLTTIDKSKLDISKEIKEEIGHSGSGSKIIISNSEIKSLINEIKSNFNIIVKDETKLNGNYNFILNKNSLENLTKEIEKYGLSLKKEIENEKIFVYTLN
jgi:uncharacterized protein (TIGR03435 family)